MTELSPTRQAEILNWMRLAYAKGVGPVRFWQLLDRYKTVEKALSYLQDTPTAFGKVKIDFPQKEALEKNLSALLEFGGNVLLGSDPDFPASLKMARDCPPLLFYKGDLSLLQERIIAIVGARNASLNGRKLASLFASDLSQKDFVICSGLARGIDTEAHKTSHNGKTIAVLAGGLNIFYPEENKQLQENIFKEGLVLTEAPFNTNPQARHFPKRNRIVACLSEATLVIEANLKSGSLITAKHAIDYGRDVMAVPGSPLDPHCEGSNELIKNGAALIRNIDDILETVDSLKNLSHPAFMKSTPKKTENLFTQLEPETPPNTQINIEKNKETLEIQITSLLGSSPIHVDEIIRECHLSPSTVIAKLQELELEGTIDIGTGNMVRLL